MNLNNGARIMATRFISDNQRKPDRWSGQYYLKCKQQINDGSEIQYQMFCNVLKTMPDGRLKIEVFGDRYRVSESIRNKSRIRYVEADRVADKRWERMI